MGDETEHEADSADVEHERIEQEHRNDAGLGPGLAGQRKMQQRQDDAQGGDG
jgi:hypothetical protein